MAAIGGREVGEDSGEVRWWVKQMKDTDLAWKKPNLLTKSVLGEIDVESNTVEEENGVANQRRRQGKGEAEAAAILRRKVKDCLR